MKEENKEAHIITETTLCSHTLSTLWLEGSITTSSRLGYWLHAYRKPTHKNMHIGPFAGDTSYWNRPQLVLNALKSNLPKSSRQNINAKTWQPLSDHKDFGFMLSDAPYMEIRWTVCRLHIRRDTAFLRQFQIRINMDLRDHFWKSEFWKFSHFLVAFVFWCVGIFWMLCSENS